MHQREEQQKGPCVIQCQVVAAAAPVPECLPRKYQRKVPL